METYTSPRNRNKAKAGSSAFSLQDKHLILKTEESHQAIS